MALPLARVLLAFALAAPMAVTATAAADQPKKTAKAPNAAELADQALRAYESADYAGAIDLYQQSFALSGDARNLYNVASIFDKKLHDRVQAEEFYRRYLTSTTIEPELVAKAHDRLVEIDREKSREQEKERAEREKETRELPAKAEAPPPPEQQRPAPLRTIGIVAAGVGVGALAVGSVFGISAIAQAGELDGECPNDRCRSPSGVELRDDAARAATLSTLFFLAGGVLAVGGVTLWFLAPKGERQALTLRPSLAGAVIDGRF